MKSAVSDAVRGMFAGDLSSVALATYHGVALAKTEGGCDRETTKKCAERCDFTDSCSKTISCLFVLIRGSAFVLLTTNGH